MIPMERRTPYTAILRARDETFGLATEGLLYRDSQVGTGHPGVDGLVVTRMFSSQVMRTSASIS